MAHHATKIDYEAIVIGAGIVGRCALYHLQRAGVSRVAMLERFDAQHSRGSSHSHSRITRSAYVNTDYVRLMQIAHGQEWPRLAADAGQQLIFPTRGCFFGPAESKFEDYAESVAKVGVDCEVLDLAEARREFPMFRFPTAIGAVFDRTAGVIAAARTMEALWRLAGEAGADLLTGTRVLDLQPGADSVLVTARRGEQTVEMRADRVIVCPGPWATELLPFLQPRVEVARQTVGYFQLRGAPGDFQLRRWPVWGNLGAPRDEVFYGLPAFGRPGIKIARHVTSGATDDPDETTGDVAETEVEPLREFLAREFVPAVERHLHAEHCHYTNTATEDYIVDLHADSPRIAVGAGMSGHGFKLAPVCGRALAELVLHGQSSMPEFEAMRPTFSIAGP